MFTSSSSMIVQPSETQEFIPTKTSPSVSYVEQIRQIMTHPFFTGKCPACHTKLHLRARIQGEAHCHACGWHDH